MTADRKTPARIPVSIAALCLAVILVVIAFFPPGGSAGTVTAGPAAPGSCPGTIPALHTIPLVLPGTCPAVIQTAGAGPAVPEQIASAELVLTRPPAADLIPYTARGFSRSTEAAVAWWVSPGFMDNTSEFRMYQRKPAEARAACPEEHRIFFHRNRAR